MFRLIRTYGPNVFAACRDVRRILATSCYGALTLALSSVSPASATDSILAPTGRLRAAYIVTNVAQGRVDPVTGAVTGVIAEITRELGRSENVPISVAPLPTAAAVLEAVRSGAADIGFVAPNPERTGGVLYSSTYMLVEQSALVRTDSPLRSVSELDRSGQVIGINTDDSVGVWLRQRLTAATVRATPDYSLQDAVQWLQSGDVVAFAGGRQRLASATRHVPGLRLLDDNFYGVPQAIAVPLGQENRVTLLNSALEEFRRSGRLAGWIASSGIEGLSVAPSAPPPR
jgi:polar amino acid transport system substrate-binding protein